MGHIVPNTGYDQFQKKSLWLADKRVDLDSIRLYSGDIVRTIQWYEKITGISVLDLVYRLYCDNPPHVHSHTQLVHIKISMTQTFGTAEAHLFQKQILSPSDSLH